MLGATTDYDANGNLILLPNMQMKYDASNGLMRIDTQAGPSDTATTQESAHLAQSADDSESFSFYRGTRNWRRLLL